MDIELNEIENLKNKDENIKVMQNGEFIWKITDMWNKIRSNSFSHSFTYSEPFYLSQFGYKVQLRMDFNSVNQGELSLFLYLCKGEWDNILLWPFNATINFKVLNQENVINLTFNTVDGKRCNERPMQERSATGFGFINFVTMTDLLRRDVIMDDDCMYIKSYITPKNKYGRWLWD